MKIGKLVIDVNSFFQPKLGSKPLGLDSGIYCFYGIQGKGKTYSAVRECVKRLNENPQCYCVTNTHIALSRCYFCNNLNEIIKNNDDNVIFLLDEIFKLVGKNDRVPHDFLAWLNQSRKHKRTVILISQQWLELPLTLRRCCNRAIRCGGIRDIQFNHWANADLMSYDNLSGEYVAPVYKYEFFKRTKAIGSIYNSWESIELIYGKIKS